MAIKISILQKGYLERVYKMRRSFSFHDKFSSERTRCHGKFTNQGGRLEWIKNERNLQEM